MGLALNYFAFYYEIRGLREESYTIAKTAFDESMKVLDDLEKYKAKDILHIIQLIKENIILWSNEMNEEEKIKFIIISKWRKVKYKLKKINQKKWNDWWKSKRYILYTLISKKTIRKSWWICFWKK